MTTFDFQAFIASPEGLAVKGLLVLAFADLLTGSYAALKDGTFALDAIGAFIRKHLMGRVLPVATLLGAAFFLNDQMLRATALAAAATYTAETLASLKGNFLPPSETAKAQADPSSLVNPVPTD